MRELVAVVSAGGPRFVDELRRVWDDGDALLPVDPRLPPVLVERLLDSLRPHAVVTADGTRTRRGDGRAVDEGDALVVATSGTTGDPKGVVLAHGAVESSARATSVRLDVDPARHRWLACLPVAHIGGLSVVTRCVVTGTPLVAHAGFDAVAAGRAAREDGCTHVSLVATALGRIDPASFERILLGGAAPPPQLPPNVTTTYGLTETGSGIWYHDADGDRDGPIDGAEVRVVEGRIEVRGPMLLRCYRTTGADGSIADRDPKDPAGWFATGDLGELDAATGRLTVHGRAGDLIVTGGQKVWPQAVEAVLAEHPGVADVLVRGEADPEWGQRVVAVVVPADAASPPSLDELRSFGRDRLAPYALPRTVEYAGSLARTALGKLRRTP